MRSIFTCACVLSLCAGCAVPMAEFSRTVQQSVETQPLTSVDLSTFNGAISVEAHELPTLDMEITYKAYGENEAAAQKACEQMDCDISVEDGKLKITATKSPTLLRSASVAFKVKAPANCAFAMDTSNGSISANNLQASVDAHTSNGSITLQNIAQSVMAKTSNGTIRIEGCSGSIDLKTSNGKVIYSGNLVGAENRIQTSNGRVEVNLNPSTLTEVSSKTSNGSIRCALPTQRVLVDKKHQYDAIVGEGDNQLVTKLSIQTSNGSITIEPISIEAAVPTDGEITSESALTL